MLDLQQDESQVVNKEQGVDHAVGVADHFEIVEPAFLLVEDPHAVEKPERKHEDEQQDGEGGPEQVDPWHGGP